MTNMPKQLAPADVQSIQRALDDARAGRATLSQLAHAHDLASVASRKGVYLNGTVAELRKHIHALAPEPPSNKAGSDLMRDTVVGTISGIAIYYILKGMDKT